MNVIVGIALTGIAGWIAGEFGYKALIAVVIGEIGQMFIHLGAG